MKKVLLTGCVGAAALAALAIPPIVQRDNIRPLNANLYETTQDNGTEKMELSRGMREGVARTRTENNNKPYKAPAQQTANTDIATMYGYLWWSNNLANLPGIYEVKPILGQRLFTDANYDLYGFKTLNGWYLEYEDAIGSVTIQMNVDEGYIFGYSYFEKDLKTGSTRNSVSYPLQTLMFQKCSYMPELNKIYGYLGDLSSS